MAGSVIKECNLRTTPEDVHSHGGLNMIPPRRSHHDKRKCKETQFREFKKLVILDKNKNIILVGLSNDVEKLLLKNGRLLKLREGAIEEWMGWSGRQRAEYNKHELRLLNSNAAKKIYHGLKTYMEILKQILEKSGIENVYHTSVLERRYLKFEKNHLDICFAALNSSLHSMLKDQTVRNKNGKVVTFRYINLAHQYHCSDYKTIFKVSEVEDWERELRRREQATSAPQFNTKAYHTGLVHRSLPAYKQLFRIVSSKVDAYL